MSVTCSTFGGYVWTFQVSYNQVISKNALISAINYKIILISTFCFLLNCCFSVLQRYKILLSLIAWWQKKYAELPLFSTHSFEKHYHFCTLEAQKSGRYWNAFGWKKLACYSASFMSSTSASFSLQVEKTTLPTILKVFFLVGRIKHYRVCLPLFRHRRNTTILLLSITKPQKSRQRKRNNFAKTCR